MNSSGSVSGAVLIRPSAQRVLLSIFLLLCFCGCRKADAPPPPLTLEQLPSAIEKAFSRAKPEATEKVNELQAALREKDYAKAFMALQAVSAIPGLNREQANVAGAGLITLNNALQEAQSQGDQNAAQALQSYHATK
ncbi:MAG TPA: hypothetical protein VFE51_12700 [Verrucomicrobiae bacterium]|nr:hypothetical protein [Verrucomicrobiae bacterium]